MNKSILLSLLSFGIIVPESVLAQCVVTQACTTLGYKSRNSCDNGIKCPFGNLWYCPCDSSFKYSCTGANESPSSVKCGSKYGSCNCKSGYHWNNGVCQPDRPTCQVGWYYYSDDSCSYTYLPTKSVIGIVVYVNPDGKGGQAMLAGYLNSSYKWGEENVDVPNLSNYSKNEAMSDLNSCSNTDEIASWNYPAAFAARNLTNNGKKWCLPAAGVLKVLYDNKIAYNKAVSISGGIELQKDERLWSSTEYGYLSAWLLDLSSGTFFNFNKNTENVRIRPVFEF